MQLSSTEPRQYDTDGAIAFWWDSPTARRGVAGGLRFCPDAQCSCTTASFVGASVDGDDRGIHLDDGRLQITRDENAGQPDRLGIALELSLDSGRVKATRKDDLEIAHEVESQLDGEFLDQLWVKHLGGKGMDTSPAPEPDKLGWTPGHTVPYGALFPMSRPSVFALGDEPYGLVDQYEADPLAEDDAGLVWLTFVPIGGDAPPAEYGSAVVRVDGDGAWEADHIVRIEGNHDADIRDLLAQAQRLNPNRRMFRLRRDAVVEAMVDTVREARKPKVEAVVPGANVNRNDPCPCGSGKKFKHCCLGGRE